MAIMMWPGIADSLADFIKLRIAYRNIKMHTYRQQ